MPRRVRSLSLAVVAVIGSTGLVLAGLSAPAAAAAHPAVHFMSTVRGAHAARPGGSRVKNLQYQGGSVQTAPVVYLVEWGSQWNAGDPSGEVALLQKFFGDFGTGGGSCGTWSCTTTQYCSGVAVGSTSCPTGPQDVGVLNGSTGVHTWADTSTAAPGSPSQSALAAEAVRAAGHFGNTSVNAQYVILTASGDDPSGFGSSYCAWHSSTSTSSGTISYTNLPYITDAGASCGANFNNLGPNAGITIVAGHEFAESTTDPFPSSGWLDSSGSEIGDKCAWASATANENVGSGSFPVQPLWSNAVSGCAQ